ALQAGLTAAALQDLELCFQQDQNNATVRYMLGRARRAAGTKNLAFAELNQALRLDQRLLGARLELANLYLEMQDAQNALATLEQTPAPQKKSSAFVVQWIWALIAAGKHQEARQAIDRVLAQVKLPEFFLQDGVLRLAEKKYAEAQSAFERVL